VYNALSPLIRACTKITISITAKIIANVIKSPVFSTIAKAKIKNIELNKIDSGNKRDVKTKASVILAWPLKNKDIKWINPVPANQKIVIPIILVILLVAAIVNNLIDNPYPDYPGWLIALMGISPLIIITVSSFILMKIKGNEEGKK